MSEYNAGKSRAYYVANKEYIKARQRLYAKSSRKRKREYDKKYQIINKERISARKKKRHAERREENAVISKTYRDKNKEKLKSKELKKRYNITLAEYDKILLAQDGVCRICGGLSGKMRFHVDHNHETLKVRGLLCGNCNVGLGNFKDDTALLLKAAMYLEENK